MGALALYLYSMVQMVIAVIIFTLAGGYQPMLIGSGSMEPLIRAGDVVLLMDHDGANLGPGTVITYHDDALDGRIITHRIFAIDAAGAYVTKGDANTVPDSDTVVPSDVIGEGRVLVPYVGLPAHWLSRGEWIPLLVWLGVTAAAIVGVVPRRRGSPPPGEATLPTPPGAETVDSERPVLSRVAFGSIAATVLAFAALVLPVQAALGATTSTTASLSASEWMKIIAVTGGESHSCAARDQGLVWCWGWNDVGQLGVTGGDRTTPVLVRGPGGVGNLTSVVALSAGRKFNCAARSDGSAWCWGENTFGQLGDDSLVNNSIPVQVRGPGGVGTLGSVVAPASGEIHACARNTGGSVYCWGENSFGQLGNDTTTNSRVPVQVRGPAGAGFLSDVTRIGAGFRHTCAVKTDGTVWCWGRNDFGQLGNGTTSATATRTPVQVRGVGGTGFLTTAVEVVGGESSTCARLTDSTVACWGRNDRGQLGVAGTTRTSPVLVRGAGGSGTLTNVASLDTGQKHACVTLTTGSVWCWGWNSDGQLGNNTITDSNAPVQVRGPLNVGTFANATLIGTGYLSTCAARSDYTVWCWGRNANGQLGNGTTTGSRVPVQAM